MTWNVTRRELLVHAVNLAAALAFVRHRPSWAVAGGAVSAADGTASDDGDLLDASVVTLAGAIRSRQLSSRELVLACLQRIEAINPWLNAVVRITAESALERATHADAMLAKGVSLGPLHGIPMTIKDSLDTVGVVTTWGVGSRADHAPAHDATVESRLKRSGAILLGKTNTPELTLSFETNSPIFGPTNNPYDLDRTAGGSSGGAAAIVAAGGSPFDIGSDTGGSVRVPAHFCGVTGIRPTSGRVPRTGNAIGPGGLLDMLTTVGPIARYVEDLELILPLVSGPDASDPSIVPVPWNAPEDAGLKGLRGAFHVDNGIRAATDETVSAVRSAVVALSDGGVHLEQARPPPIDQTLEIFLELLNWDNGAWRAFLLGRRATEPSLAGGEDIAARIIRMIDRWDRYREEMGRFMASYDLMVCPVNAVPALPHGEVAENLDAFSYTMAYSLTGWPAVVVRAGTSAEGLPIGVQLVSRPWREDIALSAAKRVEAVLASVG